jgi:2-dehydro-3-deoxyphosphooctonate aldolase (KDO 8-P synthase)
VVDMRNFARLRAATNAAVVFDATHAVQQPGQGIGGASGGSREHVPALLAAAAVAGADGFFVETHPDPARAASDPATQWPLDRLDALIGRTLDLWARAHD